MHAGGALVGGVLLRVLARPDDNLVVIRVEQGGRVITAVLPRLVTYDVVTAVIGALGINHEAERMRDKPGQGPCPGAPARTGRRRDRLATAAKWARSKAATTSKPRP